jgi:hypothetical protein
LISEKQQYIRKEPKKIEGLHDGGLFNRMFSLSTMHCVKWNPRFDP